MIIDGHAHACGDCLSTESTEKYLKNNGIDKILLCGGEPNSTKNYCYPMLSKIFKKDGLSYLFNKIICHVTSKSHMSQFIDEQNNKVFEMHKSSPDKIINAYWVNPNEDNCIEKMNDFYLQKTFSIIKLHQCWTDFDIDCENFKRIAEWSRKKNIPIFIHLLNEKQVDKIIEFANNNQEVTIIIAHLIGISKMCLKLHSDNVYFDLSAPQLYSYKSLRNAIEKFGANRFLAGSDTPYGKNNFNIVRDRVHTLNLSDKETAWICGETLNGLLNI